MGMKQIAMVVLGGAALSLLSQDEDPSSHGVIVASPFAPGWNDEWNPLLGVDTTPIENPGSYDPAQQGLDLTQPSTTTNTPKAEADIYVAPGTAQIIGHDRFGNPEYGYYDSRGVLNIGRGPYGNW